MKANHQKMSDQCPSCGNPFWLNEIRCSTCNYEPHSTKDKWKQANMGKQRTKPIANRTGKK